LILVEAAKRSTMDGDRERLPHKPPYGGA